MNLYLRLIGLIIRLLRVERRGPLDASRVAFRVWPNDCDLNLHMNNGRYLAFMDLGRVHLMAQAGLLPVIRRERWTAVIGAVEIQFVRPLAPLQPFELVTRVVTWDDKYIYLEQTFESRGTLYAHAFVKGLFLTRGGRVEASRAVEAAGYSGEAPEMPEELRKWAEIKEAKKQRAESMQPGTRDQQRDR